MMDMAQAQFDRHLKPGDARAALDRIASSQAFQSSRFSSSVYEDEPILRTGSQFRRDTESSRPYQLIHQLAQREDLRYAPAARVFYEQARALADFDGTGDPTVPFKSYFPTYQAMNDRQLSSYLAWRAQARKGVIAASTASYAFVYIYELLMGVGTQEGLPALAALTSFWVAWKKQAATDVGLLDFYLHIWLRDYIVYHGLDRSLLERVSGPASQRDVVDVYAAVPVLREAEALVLAGGSLVGDMAQKTFDAMCLASSFRLTGSKFFKDYPAETQAVTCGVFARLVQHCAHRRKVGYVDGLFGAEQRRAHPMFYGAVFYAPQTHPDATYRVSDSEAYICRDGTWRRRVPCAEETRSRDLGLLMHTVDHEMRRIWEYPKQVRAYEVPRYLEGFVTKEATAAHEAWLAAQTPKIHIDRSLLRGIRTAAVKTRESLLVDEERAEEPTVAGVGAAPHSGVAPAVSPVTTALGTLREEAGLYAMSQAGRTHATPGSCAVPAAGAAADSSTVFSAGKASAAFASGVIAPSGTEAVPGVVLAAGESTMASALNAAPGLNVRPTAGKEAVDFALGVDCAALGAPCGLTTSELVFLQALLAGDVAGAKAAVGAGMASLMVDAVNEKLYDEIGDAAIEFDGDAPQLVEDYRPDVEELLS